MLSPARALVVALVIAAPLVAATQASAATCSDYATQADAQRAADTRDGDGDGIFCETLPCPCVKPGEGGGSTETRPRTAPRVIRARITDVVDGDTIKVRADGGERQTYTVRLIGIDTPETKRPGVGIECGGPEASSQMLKLAFTDGGRGRRVTLRTDPTQDTFDRYDRLLAYVATRAGVQLQTRMLSAGWATTYVYNGHPFQRVKRFRNAEKRARVAGRGVYGMCDGDFHAGG
jgi:micrococcal nuclease